MRTAADIPGSATVESCFENRFSQFFESFEAVKKSRHGIHFCQKTQRAWRLQQQTEPRASASGYLTVDPLAMHARA
jgi:hypothetical protein